MSIGIGSDIVIGRHIGVRLSGGGASLDADAATLIAAMTTAPDATRQGLINDLIVGLKADGVWAELDELWVTAAHAEQAALLGWKRYKNLTAVNAPTFTVDRGFASNGTTSYLNTNFVPSTDGVQYQLNDASFGVYSRTDNQTTGAYDMSADSGSARAHIRMSFNVPPVYAGQSRVNRDVSAALTTATPPSTGLWSGRRSGNVLQLLRNGSVLATGPETSAFDGVPANSFLLGTTPISLSSFTTRQYAAAFVGASMSEAQQLALFNRLETYLDAIGAGVVS